MQQLVYVGVALLMIFLATSQVYAGPMEEKKLNYLEELIRSAIECK